ncbi:MAG: virulence RhuM family protein [Treponema sp.]|nr:virulence RhuM family protein [Treponema sp.]
MTASDGKTYDVEYYSLDVIISVGYRVKSKRGIEFRKWANSVLKQYILKGYAANDRCLEELRQTLQIIRRTEKMFILRCRKKPQIFCILSQRIIPSVMVTKE